MPYIIFTHHNYSIISYFISDWGKEYLARMFFFEELESNENQEQRNRSKSDYKLLASLSRSGQFKV